MKLKHSTKVVQFRLYNFQIFEFSKFHLNAKDFMKKNKIFIELNLIDKRNGYFFYKCNITSDDAINNNDNLININNNNKVHILDYFNKENEKINNEINNFNEINFKNYPKKRKAVIPYLL